MNEVARGHDGTACVQSFHSSGLMSFPLVNLSSPSLPVSPSLPPPFLLANLPTSPSVLCTTPGHRGDQTDIWRTFPSWFPVLQSRHLKRYVTRASRETSVPEGTSKRDPGRNVGGLCGRKRQVGICLRDKNTKRMRKRVLGRGDSLCQGQEVRECREQSFRVPELGRQGCRGIFVSG